VVCWVYGGNIGVGRGAYARACVFFHMVGDSDWASASMEVVEGNSARVDGAGRGVLLHFTQRYCKNSLEQGSKQTNFALYAVASSVGAIFYGVKNSSCGWANDEPAVSGDFRACANFG